MLVTSRTWLVVALLAATSSAGCGDDATVQTLLLEITSDAPASGPGLEELRLLFHEGAGADMVRYPESAAGISYVVSEDLDFDPVRAAVHIEVNYGSTTFSGAEVTLTASGLVGGAIATLFQGEVDLSAKVIQPVHLAALAGAAACDADADGFSDCALEGCCPGGADALADCEPEDAAANPWGTEDSCADCGDGIDQDCAGGDAVCVDVDDDAIPDCLEVECGLDDQGVGPGLPELCDYKDNNCDGVADEGFTWQDKDGTVVWPGGECGLGACAGGTFDCDPVDPTAQPACSTADLAAAMETCGDDVDDDCDGETDEGCVQDDVDGDGKTEDDGDCDDFDAGRFPGALEPCCDPVYIGNPAEEKVCDRNCVVGDHAFCDPEDKDLDGFTPPNDCDDTDPLVYPGAQEKCGDGKDQDCVAGDLPCDGVSDGDGDQWPTEADCNDGDASVHPEAVEVCDAVDNDCDGLTDEGNPDDVDVTETVPGGSCGSDVGECGNTTGTWVCAAVPGPTWEAGTVGCVGETLPIDELCDYLDNDCDGTTDEDFPYGGALTGEGCQGVGQCSLALGGQVECAFAGESTCSTNPNGSAPADVAETCNGQDDDCDGTTDEGVPVAQHLCLVEGECGKPEAVFSCVVDPQPAGLGQWDCDYGAIPTYEAGQELSCDALDNDCDGFTDNDLPSGLSVGDGCDGPDADLCAGGFVVCAATGEAPGATACAEEAGALQPETCDYADNDCNEIADDPWLDQLGTPCGVGECVGGQYECSQNGSTVVCDTMPAGQQANAGSKDKAFPDVCDYKDNDCDGGTDEDFAPPSGVLGDPCDSPSDTDLCANGTFTCTDDGTTVECVNETILNIVEVCNDEDDDCDGQTDENLTSIVDAGCDTDGACGEAGQTTALCTAGDWACSYNSDSYQAGDELSRCDGLDNDCDGVTDEDFSVGGAIHYTEPDGVTESTLGLPCGLGACAGGTVQCAPDEATLRCSSAGSIADEVCNNIDDDCDGLTDEGLTGIGEAGCDTDGACGEEGQTTALCTAGVWACFYQSANYQADDELGRCDGLDNDCDGATDEDFLVGGSVLYTEPDGATTHYWGQACGLGECDGGIVICDPGDAAKLTCDSLGAISSDVCNDLDDDCNGVTDDAFLPGGTETFDDLGAPKAKTEGCGTGACEGGTVICADAATLTCDTLGQISAETCNAGDDDCDGDVDEDFEPGGPQSWTDPYEGQSGLQLGDDCGFGACDGGEIVCAEDGGLTCTTVADSTPELCDDQDNDCDNKVDEDYKSGGTIKYTDAGYPADDGKHWGQGCGTGECGGGLVLCDELEPTQLTCSTIGLRADELCDDKDNDCDGLFDEDYAEGGDVTFDGGPFAADGDKWLGLTCGTGACSDGLVVCDGADPELLTLTCSKLGNADDETCDGTDEDCDGDIDEDFKDVAGGATKPYHDPADPQTDLFLDDDCGAGACEGGVVECIAGVASCSTAAEASDDVSCNDVDDDCDGVVDDLFVPGGPAGYNDDGALKQLGESCGTGICAGTVVCDLQIFLATCSGASNDVGADELACDSLDDDCDGATDEDFDLGTTCGVGACGGGARECSPDDSMSICSTMPAGAFFPVAGSANAAQDEVCDSDPTLGDSGVDNDCDGTIDEDFKAGGTVKFDGGPYGGDAGKHLGQACGTGECVGGLVVCGVGGETLTCTTLVGATGEVCNGEDDDCDGSTDEGLGQTTCGLGECEHTIDNCVGGVDQVCDPMEGQAAEICDGKDNDCDGFTDEEDDLVLDEPCEDQDGICDGALKLAQRCVGGVWALGCASPDYEANDAAYELTETSCDGLDNDCDGGTDEGWGEITCGEGLCENTIEECAGVAGPQVCVPLSGNSEGEVCDGQDNDCDGLTDAADANAAPMALDESCEDQDGVCDGAMKLAERCVGGSWSVTCDATDYGQHSDLYEAVEVTCDGFDNDCDGDTDEDVEAISCGVGACATTIAGCIGGVPQTADDCVAAQPAPTSEVCDGDDNDCDGLIDAADDNAAPMVLDELCGDQKGVCLDAITPAVRCVGGVWQDCTAADYLAHNPWFEEVESLCDELDNDCDDHTDDFGDQVCGLGECAHNVLVCDGGADPCTPAEKLVGASVDETCDGDDNDCDGSTDEAEQLPADVACEDQQGVCAGAMKPVALCVGGGWEACTASVYEPWALATFGVPYQGVVETTCDGEDNDCSGVADDTFTTLGDACGGSDCPGQLECNATGADVRCNSMNVGGEVGSGWSDVVEVCDTVDNDCDGETDETFTDLGDACGTGICEGGTMVCDGADTVCSTAALAALDDSLCNALDDDCDGSTDEDCAAKCGTLGVGCPAGYTCQTTYCSDGAGHVFVPAGLSTRGCKNVGDCGGDCAAATDAPEGEVVLDAFVIDALEVKAGDYCACVNDNASCTDPTIPLPGAKPNCQAWQSSPPDPPLDAHPVFGIDWDQADAYCAWAGMRLCTEHEWEKAARGTDGACYPWGSTAPDCDKAVMDAGGGAGCGEGHELPGGLKTFGKSPYGAFDMVGNVAEWVADWYQADYYAASPQVNPPGPDSGSAHVVRGGHWQDAGSPELSTWNRDSNSSTDQKIGFRCCADFDQSP